MSSNYTYSYNIPKDEHFSFSGQFLAGVELGKTVDADAVRGVNVALQVTAASVPYCTHFQEIGCTQ